MSINRWDFDKFEDCMEPDDDGDYVLYADHVQAVAEAERQAVEQYQTAMRPIDVRATQLAIQQGAANERSRIRQAVENLGWVDGIEYENFDGIVKTVLSIIDGGE